MADNEKLLELFRQGTQLQEIKRKTNMSINNICKLKRKFIDAGLLTEKAKTTKIPDKLAKEWDNTVRDIKIKLNKKNDDKLKEEWDDTVKKLKDSGADLNQIYLVEQRYNLGGKT